MEYIAQLGLVALGSRMRAISDRLYATADEVYRASGLQLQGRWLPLLRILHDRGPQTVGEIAEAVGQTHSAVSQLADKLTDLGWVDVAIDPADKRRRRLALTAHAETELRAAKPLWRAIEDLFTRHCREQGIDLLHTLATFENVLAPTLAGAIVERAATQDRAALRIVAFDPALRDHFYRLNEAWLRKYFYVEEIDHRVLSDPETEIIARGGTILFAMLGDEVVGTCALMPEADGADAEGVDAEGVDVKDTFELTKMAVDEQRQGLGIGRALMAAAIDEFRRRDGRRLFLETNSKLTPAVRLYESMGFEHQPSIKPDSHYDRANVYMVWRDPARPAG
jgi:ribosomal protein S18 acetylase RimI-like enzyme/DNA-binding MarR family transcriptional regulator